MPRARGGIEVTLLGGFPANIEKELEDRLWKALVAASEDLFIDIKSNTPVAFASGDAPAGWPLSFAAGKTPSRSIPGGTLRRSNQLKPNRSRLAMTFHNSAPYAATIHEGSTGIIGRPFITETILKGIGTFRSNLETELERGFTLP